MPTQPAKKKAPAKKQTEFPAIFKALRAILAPYVGKNMRVVDDKPDYYCIETAFSVMGRGPVMFGAVRRGKGYVSYHLLPLYMNPQLQSKISAELKKRKQGKACFNFSKPDEKLFAEIAELTKLGLEGFRKLSQTAPIV
ncbi:MAG TPA: hypothetical protein VKY85_19790 [Candidatus Angelobacter sp.]|nr:hypothetical protein [Candidatus Angelobacter sp.]